MLGLPPSLMMTIVVVAAVLAALKGLLAVPRAQPMPVARRFMTPRELRMQAALERCLPHLRLHAQVSMGALLKPSPRVQPRDWLAARNRFSQKIVDFVAQDRATGEIVALIEIDDASHDDARDARRDAMTGAAGYLTVRVGRHVAPRLAEVREAVWPLLETTAPRG